MWRAVLEPVYDCTLAERHGFEVVKKSVAA
jgi:hypothetical protein